MQNGRTDDTIEILQKVSPKSNVGLTETWFGSRHQVKTKIWTP